MTGASVGGRSIRSRLTGTIMVVTALVAGLAVVTGLRTFEHQVRQRAVDRAVTDLAEMVPIGESANAIIVTDLGFGISPFEAGFDPDFEDDFGAGFADDARRALVQLDRSGLADLAFDAFADEDGLLHVLLWDGTVASIDRALESTRVRPAEEVTDEVLVFQFDLEQLAILTFGPLGDTASSGAADRRIEPVIAPMDGRDLGLLVDTTDELSTVDELRTPLWVSAAALTMLAGAATWLLTGRALRPVAAITDRVERISAGTLDGRVPEPTTTDEIGTLARTMNQMLARLERSDLQRRQFVSDASHELRTPVAVLRSEAEVASRAPATTSVPDLARVVLAEAGRLERLVEDLLTLARSDERPTSGPGPAGATEIDVDDVVLAEAERSRRLPVDLGQVSAGRVLARGDDLGRAIGHLLDNAARHGRSQVAVGVGTEAGRVRIWVDDDGAGIPEDDRVRVFGRFTRLDEARDRDRGGAGLGLAVVAETVSALGGTVSIDRSPLGGARVVVDLPAAPGDRSPAR